MGTPTDDAIAAHVAFCRSRVWGSIYRPIYETNPPMPQVAAFRSPTMPSGILLVDTPVAEQVDEDVGPVAGLIKFRQKRSSGELSWEQQLNSQRIAAIRKWVRIILTAAVAFDLGRRLEKGAPLGGSIAAGLKHVFSGKATGTLHNRAGPILRYIQWCNNNAVIPFPVFERNVYNFMFEVGNSAAPTFLRSFLVSLTFCNFILGLTGSDDAIASQRVQGCARESYLMKRKLQQRPPLSVAQVKALEQYVSSMMGTPRDVYAAGCFLLCIYMRARFSDMQHMTDIVVDEVVNEGNTGGYIEAKVTRSKSAYTTERKTMFLPMAAPLIGVGGKDWFKQWQQARMLSSVPRGEELPLLPQPAGNGWLRVPMTASMGGDWLRKILVALGFDHNQVKDIGTHSCKATCLSWMSKAGIDIASRRLLGYHVDPSTKTCLVYSRDAASGPLRELDKVIGWIRELRFDADSTRSGYFNVPVGAAEPETVDVGEEDDSASDTEDSADEEPSEEQQRDLERATDDVVGEWNEHSTVEGLQLETEPTLFQNRNTRYYHVCADESEMHFRCGREISASYNRVQCRPRFFSPQCSICFKQQ